LNPVSLPLLSFQERLILNAEIAEAASPDGAAGDGVIGVVAFASFE
jgi:hypothetical protein